MVEKLRSRKFSLARRNASSRSLAAISESRPFGASRASHARKRVNAAPSRRCAARVPSTSAEFLQAFGNKQGSAARWIFALAASSRSNTQAAAVAGSTCTRAPVPARSSSAGRSEEHTSELQSQSNLVCRLLLEKKKQT